MMAYEYRLPDALKGTILEKIMSAKTPELAEAKNRLPYDRLEAGLGFAPLVRPFRGALERMAQKSQAVIAEIKKASPSAGLIREKFEPLKIAAAYDGAGAAALSILTEARYFKGGLDVLSSVRAESPLPVLRKDFIVDPYQVPEARAAGADAVLLIVALLHDGLLGTLLAEIERFGMDALVEVHSAPELERALSAGAKLIGVNSRDLRTFAVDLNVALKLARRIPPEVFAVAESGIKAREDLRRLSDAGYRGFLVGERLMRASDPAAALSELTGN